MKANHEAVVAAEGYSDEDTETVIAAIDSDIEAYKESIENFAVPNNEK